MNRKERRNKSVDGTGLATSRNKYNSKCIVKNKTDSNGNAYKEYSTYVLEAKLVVGEKVFSIGSEFIENITEFFEKQDCEIEGFKRLAKKIKKDFPRLQIILRGDALYACKQVLDICKENHWKYIIRFKEGKIKTLYKEFKKIIEIEKLSKLKNYEYAKSLDYQGYKLNIVKYMNKEKNTEFVYMTNLNITDKNLIETITLGRKRWKIENEGFNIQKNRTFNKNNFDLWKTTRRNQQWQT